MHFVNKLNIDFIGKRHLYFVITAILMFFAIAVLVVRKPVLSIEFTGGTMIQIGFKSLPPIEDLRKSLDANGWKGFTLQTQPSNQTVIIQVKKGEKSEQDIAAAVVASLKKDFSNNVKDVPDRVEFIGS